MISFAAIVVLALLTDVQKATAGKPRIIGGSEVPDNAFGEYVMILDSTKRESCGATLIKNNLVLTAAHCLFDTKVDELYFAKGNITYDWKKEVLVSADELVTAQKLIIHPNYKKYDGNDIAIAVLNKRMSAPFAKLAPKNTLPTIGTSMTAVGFGVNNDFYLTENDTGKIFGLSPPRLYAVNLTLGQAGEAPCPKVNRDPTSSKTIDGQNVFTPKEMCLLGEFFYTPLNDLGIGIQSACSGDSGGPVFHKGVQYGVAARVLDTSICSQQFLNPFTVYTKVAAHRKYFIEPIMKKYK